MVISESSLSSVMPANAGDSDKGWMPAFAGMTLFKSCILVLCCALLSLWTSVCAARDFIIDTDMGVDDVIAIVYMLNRSDVNVKAITIEGDGSVHCAPALRNLFGLLKLRKRTAIPVACGRAVPLSGHHHFPPDVRKRLDDLLGTATLLPSTHMTSHRSAVNLLASILQKSSHPVDVLAIGPLTNVAELIRKYPASKNKIRRIYIMGGAIHVRGNLDQVDPTIKNTMAEWNIYFDPKAADSVFRSGIPLTLFPLDLTNQLPVDKAFYYSLARQHKTPTGQFIFELFKRNPQIWNRNQWYFWDPLAAVIATDESIVKTVKEKIRIVLTPADKSGATIVSQQGDEVDVSVAVKKKKFKRMLLQSLS